MRESARQTISIVSDLTRGPDQLSIFNLGLSRRIPIDLVGRYKTTWTSAILLHLLTVGAPMISSL